MLARRAGALLAIAPLLRGPLLGLPRLLAPLGVGFCLTALLLFALAARLLLGLPSLLVGPLLLLTALLASPAGDPADDPAGQRFAEE